MKKTTIFLLLFFTTIIVRAQVGINTTIPNAQLDIRSSNQATPTNTDGILIPKVDTFPATNPTAAQQGMLVYLTTTSGTDLPGFYYWNNATVDWIPLGNGTNNWTTTGNTGTNPTTNFIGTVDNVDLIFKRFNVQAGKIANSNTFFGRLSGSVATGNNNTYIGTEAGRDNLAGQQNVFIGRRAGTFGTTGSDNILIGNGAGILNEANQNSFIGSFSGNGTSTGANNTFMGYSSGAGNGTGSQNAFFGSFAGNANSIGVGNTLFGTNSNVGSNNLNNSSAIGYNAMVAANNSMVLGSINGVNSATASTSVGIGTTIPRGVLDVTSSVNGVLIPRVALTSTLVQAPIANPQGGPLEVSTLVYNTATLGVSPNNVYPSFYYWNGTKWVRFDVDGENNPKYYTSVGVTPIPAIPGIYTPAPQMSITFTPKDDVVIVHFSANGFASFSGCQENLIFFQLLLNGVPVTGWQSTAENPLGVTNIRPVWMSNMHIPVTVTVGVPQTISINWMTPCNGLGSAVGTPLAAGSGGAYYANRVLTVVDPNGGGGIVGTPPVTTNMWALNGNSGTNPASQFIGTVDNQPLVFKTGSLEAMRIDIFGNLGIGTALPTSPLHVAGKIRMVDGTQANGRVLTSDVNGTATWRNASDNAWGLTGNTATNPATQFVGTVDNQPLVLRTNNLEQFRLTETGDVGIGTTTPVGNLELRKPNPIFRVAADDFSSSFLQLYEITGGNPFGYQFQYDGNLDKLHLWSKGFAGNDAIRMTWLKDGKVGIGTVNPQAQLELLDDNITTTSTTRGNLHVMTTNPQGIDVGASITLGGYYDDLATTMRVFGSVEARKANASSTSSSGYLMFKTNNTGILSERMRITNAGDVGIGTVAPGGQFQLSLDEGRKPGTNTWTIVSDQRLKTINGNYTKGLNEILQLNPIRFNYKNNGERTFEKEVLDTEFAGFIAQEVQPLFPDAVGTDADGFLNFNIHPILIASVNAIKELNAKNQSLEEENQQLKQQLELLLAQQKNQESLNKTIVERLSALEIKN